MDVTDWQEQLEASGEVRMHRAAAKFLVEFGGLNVEIDGPGSTSACEPFELDPALCVGEEDRFAGWGADLGCSLFPIGELDQGRFFLGISEVGESLTLDVMERNWSRARS